MRDPAEIVREQVRKLLKARTDVKQKEFGEAIGRGFSWVSAFLGGTRDANDLRLVVRIARYFGVSVGYLLNETDRGFDAGAMTLLTTWQALDSGDRDAVLQLALQLKRGTEGTDDGGSSEPDGGPHSGGPRTDPTIGKARAKKRR